jgi:hypothetical protein
MVDLDFIFFKNYKTFNAAWFVKYATDEVEAMKKKDESEKVNPLNETGLSFDKL